MPENRQKALQRMRLAYKELDLSLLDLSTIPAELGRLKKLNHLYLGGNQLAAFPEDVFKLNDLTKLALWVNRISEIPPDIIHLQNLERLDLNYNQLTQIPEVVFHLPRLKYLYLYGNPIELIPLELLGEGVGVNCLPMLRNYYKAMLKSKKKRYCESKIFVVGAKGSGKSSLARSIDKRAAYEAPHYHTSKGVHIDKLTLAYQEEDGTHYVRLNMWDFNGRETHVPTNQFFFTRRALYLLVRDANKKPTYASCDYWFQLIRLLSNDSPVLVAQNKHDGDMLKDKMTETDALNYQEQFENIKGFFVTSCKTGKGVNALYDAIKEQVHQLPHVENEIPEVWLKVRNVLEKMPSPVIAYDKLVKIGKQHYLDRLGVYYLCDYLHALGAVFRFKDEELLKNVVVIKPSWAINAFFVILDSRTGAEKKGILDFDEIKQVWSSKGYQHLHKVLLQLMQKFELCFEVGETGTYVFPQMLSEKPIDYEWNSEYGFNYKISYPFRPGGIFTRFMAKMKPYLQKDKYWKNGILLHYKETDALILNKPQKNEISVSIKGFGYRNLLTIIRYHFDEIHHSLNYPKKKIEY